MGPQPTLPATPAASPPSAASSSKDGVLAGSFALRRWFRDDAAASAHLAALRWKEKCMCGVLVNDPLERVQLPDATRFPCD